MWLSSNIFIGLLGLIIGSFLNCLIWRLYRSESLAGRSYCPKCRHNISWYDNIPVFSFIFLRGRCRFCRQAISWQYPAVEMVTALLFLLVWQKYGPSFLGAEAGFDWFLYLSFGRDLLLVSAWMVIFVYDSRWRLVPMNFLWPVIIILFLVQIFLLPLVWPLFLFGALGAGFFYLQYLLTAKRGIGEGDIWLGLLMGLMLPNGPQLFLAILLSYSLGALVSLCLLWLGLKKWRSAIALGPFLAIGTVGAWFWGELIINWYFNLFL